MNYFQQTIIEKGKHSLTRTVRIKYVYYFDVLKNLNQQCIAISITQLHTKQAHSKKKAWLTPFYFIRFPLNAVTSLPEVALPDNQSTTAGKKIPNSPEVSVCKWG